MRPAVVAVIAALVLCSSVRAEALDDREQQARRHFASGERSFQEGDFDHAIDEFKRAYELSPAPGLLFNIAQAYRAKRDRERAIYFYEAYLQDAPAGSERGFAQARLSELRPTARPVDRGSGLRVAGALTAGGGLAMVAAGMVFALQARSQLPDGDRDAARSAQTRGILFTGAGAAVLIGGGVLYYMGTRERPVVLAGSVGGGGASVALTVGF